MHSGSGAPITRHRAGHKGGREAAKVAQPTRGGVDHEPHHQSTKQALLTFSSPRARIETMKDELQCSFGQILEASDGRVGGSEWISFINGRERLQTPREIGDLGKKLHLRVVEWLKQEALQDIAASPALAIELVRLGRNVDRLLSYTGDLSARSLGARLEKVAKSRAADEIR